MFYLLICFLTPFSCLVPAGVPVRVPVRGRRVGREEGVRRGVHGGVVCLLAPHQEEQALAALRLFTHRSEQVGWGRGGRWRGERGGEVGWVGEGRGRKGREGRVGGGK